MKLKENYKVIISETAKADIKKNANWYNKKQAGLGKRFTQSLRECIKTIKLQPESSRVRYRNNRAIIPQKFPYLIIYNINEENKTISIIAVFNTNQNPIKLK